MARAKVTKLKPRTAPDPALPPGIHAARVEARRGALFEVRTLAGQRARARLADDVEEALIEERLAERGTVIVAQGEDGAVILGALQARRAVTRDAQDTARLEARRVEIDATEGVSIRVGKSAMRLDPQGGVRIVGQKMTLDIAEVVRVLAAMCELP